MRQIECYLNDQTLKDLIAAHLHQVGVFPEYEDLVDIQMSLPNKKGIRQLRVSFQPAANIIYHE